MCGADRGGMIGNPLQDLFGIGFAINREMALGIKTYLFVNPRCSVRKHDLIRFEQDHGGQKRKCGNRFH